MHPNRPTPKFHVLTEDEQETCPGFLTQKPNGRPFYAELHATYGDEGEISDRHLAALIEYRAAPAQGNDAISRPVPYFVAFTYPHCGHEECVEAVEFCLN